MSIADQELPEGVDPDRIITHSVYCENCGFNLRYATYVGICNECGSPYNARPLKMKGIFLPGSARFPTGDILVALIAGSVSVWAIRAGLRPGNMKMLSLAALSGAIAVSYAAFAVRRAGRFWRAVRVVRRIRTEEG